MLAGALAACGRAVRAPGETAAVTATVILGRGSSTLERRHDGSYRHALPSDAWVGRQVHVWVAHAATVPTSRSFEVEGSIVAVDRP